MGARHLFGTTITFGTSAFAANVLDITMPAADRPALDTTHMGTAAGAEHTNASWRTYIPSDVGSWSGCRVSMHYDPDLLPPIDEAAETITIQFQPAVGQSTGASVAFTGFMTTYSGNASLDDVAGGDYELQVTGDIAIAPGS
jgi:hypothetical protein